MQDQGYVAFVPRFLDKYVHKKNLLTQFLGSEMNYILGSLA